MAWQDRLQEAAYTPPSGTRITFLYEDVRFEIDKKTAAFNFPDADGTFVQDLGRSGRRYPLRVIFWGDEYDTEAESFENALIERGVGRLEHPVYGTIDVVPFGTINRKDDLKTAANQTIMEVTFWETTGLVYPSSQGDSLSSVTAALDQFNVAIADDFAEQLSALTVSAQVLAENFYTSLLDQVGSQFGFDVQEFKNIYDSISNSIDTLIEIPGTLAAQTMQLLQFPGLDSDGFDSLISDTTNTEQTDRNQFVISDLFALGSVSGATVAAVDSEFTIKTEAIQAAENILEQLNTVTEWRDENFPLFELIDTGGAYQQLQESVAIAAGALVEISFTLLTEQRVVLTRDRSIIDLTVELYGSLDDKLDFFISTNNLTGSEIIDVPRGREIVYYV